MALDELQIGGLGVRRKRVEDARFVRGKGNYVDDFKLPGMLHMETLRSPIAHARITSIDTSKAWMTPGVHLVITGDMAAQHVVLGLGIAAEHRCDGRNADASAEVPHQIEDAGRVSHGLFGDRIHRNGCQRNKQQCERKTLNKLWPKNIPVAGVQIERRETK